GEGDLEIYGCVPLKLEAKDGLALNNGTQQMVVVGCLCLFDAYHLLATMEASLALSLEALKGWVDAFDERIQKLRPHPGQQMVAEEVRGLVRGSRTVRTIESGDPSNGRPQDPYSFRCAPQVMGASKDA